MPHLFVVAFLAFWFSGPLPPAFSETVGAGDLVIERPWARASIGMSRPAAAYMTIRNDGAAPEVLTGIETSVAVIAEVHKTEMTDGVSKMRPAGPVEIPARGSIELEPGGLHVMLMKLRQQLTKGERFAMSLIFEKAGRVVVDVPIQGVGATGPDE